MLNHEHPEAIEEVLGILAADAFERTEELPIALGRIPIKHEGKPIKYFLAGQLKPRPFDLSIIDAVEGNYLDANNQLHMLAFPANFIGRGVVMLEDEDSFYRIEPDSLTACKVSRKSKRTGDVVIEGYLDPTAEIMPIAALGEPTTLILDPVVTPNRKAVDIVTKPLIRALVISGIDASAAALPRLYTFRRDGDVNFFRPPQLPKSRRF